MPDSKISGLTSATTPLAGTEVLPIVQGGQTRQVSVANLTAGRSVDASTLTVTGNTYLATTSGNVGVGATSVTAIYGKTLQIGSGTSEASTSLVGSTGSVYLATVGATGQLIARGGMALVLGTNDVERARIDTSGNVGIGTSSPSYKLDVAASAARIRSTSAYSGLLLSSGDPNASTRNWLVASNWNAYGDFALVQSNAQGGDPVSAGTTRLTVDASGNVGIGTSSPSNFSTYTGVTCSNTSGGFIDLKSTSATITAFVDSDSGLGRGTAGTRTNHPFAFVTGAIERARIGATGNMAIGSTDTSLGRLNVVGSAASSIPLVLDTNASYGEIQTYGSRPLYLNRQGNDVLANVGGGNFGIATTSPDAKLRVNGAAKIGEGAASNTSKLMVNTVSGVAAGIQLFQDANESWIIQNPASTTALTFANSGTERMRITATGDVGIGTSSPSYKLDIRGSAVGSNFAAISVDNTAAGSGSPANTVSINFSNGGAVKASITGAVYGDGYLAFATNNNTEKVRITAAGDVGIGTGSPAAKLDVVGSLGIRVNEDAAGTKVIQIRSNFAGLGPSIQVSTADPLLFLTSNTERMRITSTGDVGIGTTGPSVKLQVNGTSNGATLELLRLSNIGTGANTKSRLNFYAASTNYGSITGGYGASAPEMVFDINTTAGAYIWNNNATEQMRITSVGNVGIGTSSPSGKLHVYGGAIRTNTRVTNSQNYPLGHYSPGECVFEIDPTWTEAELQAFFNSSAVTWAAVADAPGGYCIYIDGAVNVGGVYNSGFSYIPVDTSDVYYMECWIQNVGSNQGHYMGSVDYNQSFSSLGGNPGSYGYWVMSNTDPGTTWTKVSGYIQGFGTSIGQFVAGTKYWTPMALFNYTAGTGTRACRISGWKVIRAYQPGNRFFSGNVGIGTSSPASKLDVAAAGTVTARVQNTTTSADAYFQAQNTVATGLFGVNATGQYMYTAQSVPTLFYNAGAERMRIDSSGNVGIGTSSPATKLHVNTGAAGYGITVAANTQTSITYQIGIDSNSNLAIYDTFATAQRLVLSTAGNLGLGVTPSAWNSTSKAIQISTFASVSQQANGAANFGFNFYESGANSFTYSTTDEACRFSALTTGGFGWFTAPSGTAGNAISFTQAMTLDANGNLLVGTTSNPGVLNTSVVVNSGASSLAGLVLQNNATGSTSTDGSHITIVGTELRIVNLENAATLFSNNGSERMRITAAGNIHTPAGATTMTDGFIYIPSAGGTPTGAATAITGTVPLYYDTTNNKLFVYNSSWQNVATAGSLPLVSTNANGVVYLNSSSQATTSTALQFNGTELGIGQAASAGIQVDVTSTSLTQIRARATTNGVDSRLVSDSSGLLGYTGTISNHPFAVYTNNTERMRITAAGAMQLSPTGGEGGELNLLNSAGGTVGGYVDVSTTDNFRLWTGNLNATMQIGQLASTGGNIQFYTAATERMRITSTGTVGIGTSTTSGAGLDVKNDAGGILVYAYGDTATAGNVSIIARNTDIGAGSLAQFGLWNDQNPFAGFNAALQYYSNASTIPNEFRIVQGANAPMTFYTNGSERMRITGDGNFLRTQAAHSTVNTSSTLNIAQVQSGIIVSTPATNITITLPTGTTLESYTANMPVGFSFELTIILVTGSGGTDITIAANGNTFYPSSGTNVTTNGPSTLRFRKTATNTFSVYRLS